MPQAHEESPVILGPSKVSKGSELGRSKSFEASFQDIVASAHCELSSRHHLKHIYTQGLGELCTKSGGLGQHAGKPCILA